MPTQGRNLSKSTGAYPDGSVFSDTGSQPNNSILYSALLQEGSMADNGISNLGAHNLSRWQEARGCVDRRLGIIELKLGWLQTVIAASRLLHACDTHARIWQEGRTECRTDLGMIAQGLHTQKGQGCAGKSKTETGAQALMASVKSIPPPSKLMM